LPRFPASSHSIADLSTAQTLTGGTNTIYALRASGTSNISGGLLKVQSVSNANMGVYVLNAASGVAPTISSNLIFGDVTQSSVGGTTASGEALVFVGGAAATPTGMFGRTGFTKYGAGNLALTGSDFLYNNLAVQQGTVSLGATGTLASQSTNLVLNATGAFDLNGRTNTFAALTNSGNAAGGLVTNFSTSAGTLVINGTSSTTFAGLIADGAGVVSLREVRHGDPHLGCAERKLHQRR
jgi:hypothetical protein